MGITHHIPAHNLQAYLAGQEGKLFILFDSGNDKQLLATMYSLEAAPVYAPLLPLSQYGPIASNGPLLVQASSALLQHFFSGENLGIVIASPLDLQALTAYCQQLFFQEYEGESVYFRFFDPRVLRSLFDYMDEDTENTLFNAKIDMLLVAEENGAAQCFTRSEADMPQTEPPPFVLRKDILESLETAHTQRKDARLHARLDLDAAYQRLPKAEKIRFLQEAKQQAQFFGFVDHDTHLLFMPEWFMVGQALRQSQKHMLVLQNPEYTISDKLSYLYCFRIFSHNPYPCPINPVALLARHKLYQALEHRIGKDGSRIPIDLMDAKDRIARMRYNELYRKYESDAVTLCDATKKLLNLPRFSMLRHSYDAYSSPSVHIETALVAELEKVICHG